MEIGKCRGVHAPEDESRGGTVTFEEKSMPGVATKKNLGTTYEDIVRDVRAGNIRPVYYLMGEESYYIDRVADYLLDAVLKPEERDFNLITLFGADTDIATVINSAKGYPMGAARLVVCVKEAQNLRDIDRLEYYLKQVQPSTVLIFCHKNGALDRRKKIAALIEKTGVLFESKKLRETQLPSFISGYLKRKKLAIDPVAAAMMAEHVGSDLNRMAGELDKLCIAMPEGSNIVTPALVERHVGISREFSIFELQDALVQKDLEKVNRIANYYDKNPKQYPAFKVLPVLFKFFSNLMLSYYAPDKSEQGMAAWLGMSDWQVRKNVMPAMQKYTGVKVMKIISEIRRTDARLKGVGGSGAEPGELMKELFFFILH